MAEANEPKKLVIKNDKGEGTTYQVNKMAAEAQNSFAKLEIVAQELDQLRLKSAIKIEQLEIAQRHYLEEIKPFLTKETLFKTESYEFENGEQYTKSSVEPQPAEN